MKESIRRLQREAERIASKHPLPEFYTRFKAPHSTARRLFFRNHLVLRLRKIVEPGFHEELGHGLYHSSRVSIDTAALLFIELEGAGVNHYAIERLMVLGIFGGLLHDICRDLENHAECGAEEAERILRDFPNFTKNEVGCICNAIKNHEAFVTSGESTRQWVQLVSDCLYDADKFRWGSDTFTHTLWYMADHKDLSPRALIERFPWGMSGTYRIIDTFRTPTGRQYGPEIIETGVEIGKEIYRYLLQNYREEP
ncbi:MAG: hypothetical protein ABFD97_05345 [Syntrophobacter sp.]